MLTPENQPWVNMKLTDRDSGIYESAEMYKKWNPFLLLKETPEAQKALIFLALFTIYLYFKQWLVLSSLPTQDSIKDRSKGSLWHDKTIKQQPSRAFGDFHKLF